MKLLQGALKMSAQVTEVVFAEAVPILVCVSSCKGKLIRDQRIVAMHEQQN